MTTRKIVESPVNAMKEATIVLCQCGCTAFNVVSQTRTSVSLSCTECGNKTSVKGPVALANVSDDELKSAVGESVVWPDPEYEPKKKKEDVEGKKKTLMLRFGVDPDAKVNVIDRAFLGVRIANYGEEEYRTQMWQGHALEYLCADWLAGAEPSVLELIEEVTEASESAMKKAGDEGKTDSVVARRGREARRRAIEQGTARLGIVEPGGGKETIEEVSMEEPVKKDDGRIDDEGRLSKAVKKAFINYAEEYREDTGNTLGLLIDVSLADATSRANKQGGFVVCVLGDERTKAVGGRRPTAYVWISSEPANMSLELEMEYSDIYEGVLDDAEVMITEVLPPDWDKVIQWAMPTFCHGREVV